MLFDQLIFKTIVRHANDATISYYTHVIKSIFRQIIIFSYGYNEYVNNMAMWRLVDTNGYCGCVSLYIV